jgi:hypothetical protein
MAKFYSFFRLIRPDVDEIEKDFLRENETALTNLVIHTSQWSAQELRDCLEKQVCEIATQACFTKKGKEKENKQKSNLVLVGLRFLLYQCHKLLILY